MLSHKYNISLPKMNVNSQQCAISCEVEKSNENWEHGAISALTLKANHFVYLLLVFKFL